MATTSYSGIGRYNYKLLPLSLSSITRCPCHSSPSKALVPARPSVVKLNFVFDGRKSVLRLGRDGGLARRRVITAVARVEPEQLGEENANQVLSIWIWDSNKFWNFFLVNLTSIYVCLCGYLLNLLVSFKFFGWICL